VIIIVIKLDLSQANEHKQIRMNNVRKRCTRYCRWAKLFICVCSIRYFIWIQFFILVTLLVRDQIEAAF